LFGGEIVAKGEARAQAMNDKVIVGAVVSLEFVPKVD
jgi:hypothetical protein